MDGGKQIFKRKFKRKKDHATLLVWSFIIILCFLFWWGIIALLVS